MNTHTLHFTAKAQLLCLLLLLCVYRAFAGVPGPCRHSVTQDHLLSLNRLIDNQLDHGCFIIYPFTERLNLSKTCYIKAALPLTLELLNSHFHYVRNSDNRRYVNTLEKVIFHLYSQRCIPSIDEEVEDSPVRFTRMMETSPKEALRKVRSILQMYLKLMTVNNGYVKWNCREEYAAEEEAETTPATGTAVTERIRVSEKKGDLCSGNAHC
ncbi:macrophage colony-stimulating factor 1a [Synchiropus splendidus]|uniref:macrophage colony-stimulating factor 1a n=1 Tax=Synchiropus splendidus TaxID=270530 RepID=UPI00237E6B9C|nr:macrophage colony-stimulating factor 1a [Synchiropus splendidus]